MAAQPPVALGRPFRPCRWAVKLPCRNWSPGRHQAPGRNSAISFPRLVVGAGPGWRGRWATGGKAVSMLASAADGRVAAAELARQNAKLAVLQSAAADAKAAKSDLAIPHLNEAAAGTAA